MKLRISPNVALPVGEENEYYAKAKLRLSSPTGDALSLNSGVIVRLAIGAGNHW